MNLVTKTPTHMKNSIKALLAILALGATALVAQAQPTLKIATLDINKAMGSYYKTETEQAKISTFEQEANKKFEGMVNEGKTMYAQFNEAQESLKSAVISDTAKQKAQSDAQNLAQALQQKEQELQNFRQEAARNIQQNMALTRQTLVEEISKAATDVAKRKGSNLVVEKGALVYADAAFDITDDVIVELNKNKPAASPAVSFPTTGAKK